LLLVADLAGSQFPVFFKRNKKLPLSIKIERVGKTRGSWADSSRASEVTRRFPFELRSEALNVLLLA
jgi:hypothetical protein